MNNYGKLTNFEFERFSRGYGALLLATVLSQLTAVFLVARTYMKEMKELLYVGRLTETDALNQLGTISMQNVTGTIWFNAPIALCIMALLLYCIFIWYRDWLGKNTFIYRLLMLPTNRLSLFFSKLTVIVLSVLGLVGTQILLLLFESQLLKWLVPMTYRVDMKLFQIINGSEILNTLIPSTFIHFLITYGIGFLAVLILFTIILMERSFRFQGMALGIIYSVFAGFALLLPFIIEIKAQKNLLYPSESFLLTLLIGLVLAGLSIAISHYLLQKRITV